MTQPNFNSKSIQLFYSYSHKDEIFREELEKHLSPLQRQGILSGWHDRKISAGKERSHEIDRYLETSQIILLLISADFLASDYCYGKEMRRALEKHAAGEARVIPVLLRSVDWSMLPFAHLQVVPTNAKPITDWSNRDKAWTSIAQSIRLICEEMQELYFNDKLIKQENMIIDSNITNKKEIYVNIELNNKNEKIGEKKATQTQLAEERKRRQWSQSPSRASGNPTSTRPLPSLHHHRSRFLLLLGLIIVLGMILGGVYIGNNVLFRKSANAPLTAQKTLNDTIKAALDSKVNPYGPFQSQLVFNDPLQQNVPANGWEVDTPIPTPPLGHQRCFFRDQAYDLLAHGVNSCEEYMSSFTNFVYQIELSQIQGQNAGIVFRETDDRNFYSFYLDLSGNYQLDLFTNQGIKILKIESCSYVNKGMRQWNLLAVKTVGSTIDLYINTLKVAEVVDATHPSGYIGVEVGAYKDTNMNEALFRYARVWQL